MVLGDSSHVYAGERDVPGTKLGIPACKASATALWAEFYFMDIIKQSVTNKKGFK